jgi:phage baseplate assembly protein W
MAVTRAQAISQTQKKVDVYSDFTTNFIKHPLTNELIVVKNEASVAQAFRNLILTNIGERFYNPLFGSNVNKTLFENFGPFVIEDISRYIKLAAQQFEKRINVLNISIAQNDQETGIVINVTFAIINNPVPVNINIFLKRVR